jgi:hypothetical protein
MAEQLEDMKWDQVCDLYEAWYEIYEYHLPRFTEGKFHNDKELWNDIFHSMQTSDWISQCRMAQGVQAAYPKDCRKFPNFQDQLDEVTRRITENKPVIKPFNKTGWNKAAVGLFMAIHDIIKLRAKEHPSNYNNLFEEK